MALLGTANAVLVPLVGAPGFLAVAAVALVQFVSSFGQTVYRVNQVSLRQTLVPAMLQGRMNATMRFIGMSVIPLGALVGGALGERIGLRPTLVLGSLGLMAAPLWLYCSPLRSQGAIERLLGTQPGVIDSLPGTD
jgi:hypothetical protein